jgi:RNase P/RNase MRP subunit POP5
VPVRRYKRRYVAFRVSGLKQFSDAEVSGAFKDAIRRVYGYHGLSKMGLKFIEFSHKEQEGIIRCNHSHIREMRAAIALLDQISGVQVAATVVRVSGTLRSLREPL